MADYKLNIKFPDGAEFSAEGPEAIVKEAFEAFLAARKESPPKREEPSPAKPDEQNASASRAPVADAVAAPAVSPELINRVFLTQGENISLRALPNGTNREADTLLLLLYGFRVLKGQMDVTSSRLAICARQSGIQMDRVDRIIGVHEQYVTKAGMRKGTKYGLNNPGIKQAEGLLTTLLG